MAMPIKDTPVLKGKDAKEFRKNMEISSQKKLSDNEIKRINENFEKLNKIANFR